jgi:REP element-mobilizing transposase RayT
MYTASGLRVRKHIRLRDFAYGGGAAYHVTINAYRKRELFGTCEGSTVDLSEIGRLVESHWSATERLRSDIVLDEFRVMPDHLHGIIHIGWTGEEPTTVPLRRKLFRIVGGFKSSATSAVRFRFRDDELDVWQPRFNDRIIRNDAELERCRQYIRENPCIWSAADME